MTPEYQRAYRLRRKANGGRPLGHNRLPMMTEIVKMAWMGMSGGQRIKFQFVCYCTVCTAIRAKTKEPL